MRLFEVSVLCKSLLEEFVCKNASLWQAVHTLMDFHVDITIYSIVKESIMFDDVLWEEGERHLHIFFGRAACQGTCS